MTGTDTQKAPAGAEGFYVTVRRGSRTGWLLGPHASKEDAEARVEDGKRLASEVDPFTAFDAFGVTKLARPAGRPLPAGKLNCRLEAEQVDQLAARLIADAIKVAPDNPAAAIDELERFLTTEWDLEATS